MNENRETVEGSGNPLDSVEDVLANQDWVFDRPTDDELSVVLSSRHGAYRITFVWQQEYSAMQFFCEFDMSVPAERRDSLARALQVVNARLWLGHFIIQENTGVPCFRHTCMFRGWTHSAGTDHVEDLVEVALAECDRYYNVFTMLSGTFSPDEALLALALSDSAGQA